MRSERLYLADILDAVGAIEGWTAGMEETRFLADEMLQSAILQKLSMIGEAAARLSEATRRGAGNSLEGDHRLSQHRRACVFLGRLASRIRYGQR